MSEAPYPEPSGFVALPGFVKSNRLNNDYYVEQFKDDPWYPIIKRTHDDLTKLLPEYNIEQIKEKFGGLRYYYLPGDEIPVNEKSWLNTREKVLAQAEAIVRYAEAWVSGFEYARKQFRDSQK
jgi:hypothetical protein